MPVKRDKEQGYLVDLHPARPRCDCVLLAPVRQYSFQRLVQPAPGGSFSAAPPTALRLAPVAPPGTDVLLSNAAVSVVAPNGWHRPCARAPTSVQPALLAMR